jgi:redox-sensitive bicupin YhaK (pirin superfamily)
MLVIRKSEDRGFADHGWLKSYHSFSFADYYDPHHMGFSVLRVINEDFIAGGMGFGEHPHRDMEIISYVMAGSLQHKDSMGNQAVIRPGEVQRMSAGTGVRHSEFNPEPNQSTHLFQIWILPKEKNIQPGYGQKSFEREIANNKLVLVASENGRDGSVSINQDANMYISRTKEGDLVPFSMNSDRHIWVQVLKGKLDINGEIVAAGDAIAAGQEKSLSLKSMVDSEVIIFDLP